MDELFSTGEAENGYPLAEDGDTGPMLPPVLDSNGFRRWLIQYIRKNKSQVQAAEWLGVAQSTVSRRLNNDAYDFPLSTVAKIAVTFGYVRLSDFVLHVEAELESKNQSRIEQMTGPVTVKGDKKPAPFIQDDIEQSRSANDQTGLSESDLRLRRAVAAVLTDVLTDVVSRLHTDDVDRETSDGTGKTHSPPGKTPPHKNKRGSGNR